MGADNMKKIIEFLKEEKATIFLVVMIIFLTLNLVRATATINELKIENNDLWEQIDRYIPNEEENY